MTDTPEGIRQQMSETNAQLSEKLVSLESQVAETVHSTGTAVNATVGAVQETVESVTNAVQDAVRSLSDVLDIKIQMKKHPWLVLGGAFALAYLAADLLEEPSPRDGRQTRRSNLPEPQPQNAANGNGHPFAESARADAMPPLATKSGVLDATWQQLNMAATAALVGIVEDAASRVVPQVMDYLSRNSVSRPTTEKSVSATSPESESC